MQAGRAAEERLGGALRHAFATSRNPAVALRGDLAQCLMRLDAID